MEQNEEQCVICHKYNDQMLMLTCIHDPCINCAAIHYAQQVKGKIKHHYYTCQICHQKTPLDVSSVIELQKLAPIQKKLTTVTDTKKAPPIAYQPSKNIHEAPLNLKKYEFENYPKKQNYQDERLLNQLPIQNRNPITSYTKKKSKICKDHQDEEVSYYCFKCLENICPQCAIHGNHHGHDVKAIKKAIGDVKKQFDGFIVRIQKNQNNNKKRKDAIIRSIKQLGQKTNHQKTLISRQFDSLRASLISKEKQILKQMDQINQRNTQLLNNQIEVLTKQIEKTNQITKSIGEILKKDSITILQQFGNQNQTIKIQIEKYEFKSTKDDISQNIKTVDNNQIKNAINRIVDQINQIKIGNQSYSINRYNPAENYLQNTQ